MDASLGVVACRRASLAQLQALSAHRVLRMSVLSAQLPGHVCALYTKTAVAIHLRGKADGLYLGPGGRGTLSP